MTQVRNFISILPSGYGHNKITVETLEGEKLSCITSNTVLTDRYKNDDDETQDEAKYDLIALVMRSNNISDWEIL